MRKDIACGPLPRTTCAASALLACTAFLGCPAEPDTTAWRQTDLWLAAPQAARRMFNTAQGRAVRSLPARPDQILHFPLELAGRPHFSFRPITNQRTACRFEVAFTNASGTSDVLYSELQRATGPNLPSIISLDLSAHAGEIGTLELRVTSQPTTPCEAHWASPRVVDSIAHRVVPREQHPNVLLLAADTLRADALGAYGRSPSVTPVLDALADQSQVWLHAFSTANNTNPSLASLMTGLYPKDHGLFDLVSRLPASHVTLAEHFQAAGYATFGAVSAAHVKNAGLDQGFDQYLRPGGQFFAETVVDMAIDWLQTDHERPSFAWLHFFDPPAPPTPPAPYAQGYRPAKAAGMAPVREWTPFREPGPLAFDPRSPTFAPGHRELYAGEIAYLDREIGRLLDFLRSRDQLDSTIVAFVADHGEALGEHDSWFRHKGLYDETTHVPLMIRWPGGEPTGRVQDLVQHFDVFATLLEAIGTISDSDARPLQQAPGRDVVFANHANDEGHMIRTKQHLFIFERATRQLPRRSKLFDLETDPGALQDLTGSNHPLETELANQLGSWRATQRSGARAEPVEIDSVERDRLRALGYGE